MDLIRLTAPSPSRFGCSIAIVALLGVAWLALHGCVEAISVPKGPSAVTATLVRLAREDKPILLVGVGTVQAKDAAQAINQAQQGGRQLEVPCKRDGNALLARAKLVLVDSQIDISGGNVKLIACVASPQNALWPGQDVNVHVLLPGRVQMTTDLAQVVHGGQLGLYAYAVGSGDKAPMHLIDVLQFQDNKTAVGEGLGGGESDAPGGQYKIKPGIALTTAGPCANVVVRA